MTLSIHWIPFYLSQDPFLPGPAIPAAAAFSASHTSHAKEKFVMPGVALWGCSAGRAPCISFSSTLLPRFPYEGQPLTEGPLTERKF